MTQVMAELDALAQVAKLVEDGNMRHAKRAAAGLLDVIGPHTADLIAKCVSIQETYPNIAVAKLRALWAVSDEHDRRVIEACAPKNGERRHVATPDQSDPRWTDRNKYQAPRKERRYNDPSARRATQAQVKAKLDAFAQISKLIEAGNFQQATRAAAKLLDVIGSRAAALIAKCLSIREANPNIAVDKLRDMWCTSDEHDRRVIEMCAPKKDARSREQKRAGRSVGVVQDATDVHQDERAGANEGPRPDGDNVYASGIDYDETAVSDLRGLPCAVCLIERNTNDCDLRHDDGLCVECRDGRTGIPTVHGGIKRTQFITDRCALIAANHPAHAAVTLVRQWWKKSTANRYDRPVIAEWIADNPVLTQEAAAEQATAVRVAAREAAWLAAEQAAQEAQAAAAAERVAEEAEAAEYAAQYTAQLADEAAAQATAVRVAAREAAWLAAEQDAEAAAVERAAAGQAAAEQAAAERLAAQRTAQEPADWYYGPDDQEEAHAIEAEYGAEAAAEWLSGALQEYKAAVAAQAAAEPATQENKAEEAEAAKNAAQCSAQLAAEEAGAAWLAAEQAAQEAQATAAAARLAAEQAAQEAEAATAAEQVAQAAAAAAGDVWLAAERAAQEAKAAAAEPAAAEPAAAQPLADCELCYNGRSLRDIRKLPTDDGLCRDCRILDSQTATKIAA